MATLTALQVISEIFKNNLDIALHALNPSTLEAETEAEAEAGDRSQGVPGQPDLT